MDITNEPNAYQKRELEPFCVMPDNFHGLYQAHLDFYKLIDTSLYKEVVEIFFEPLMNDPYYLFAQFGIDNPTDYSLDQKSPYDYQHLVANLEQLQKIAADIERGIIKKQNTTTPPTVLQRHYTIASSTSRT